MNPLIVFHIAAAAASTVLGAALLVRRKGTPLHKAIGRAWVLAMAAAALSSFGIRQLHPGHWSWIHLLSIVTLVSVTRAVLAIRAGRIVEHGYAMTGAYTGMAIAGIAAIVVPGRLLSEMIAGWLA